MKYAMKTYYLEFFAVEAPVGVVIGATEHKRICFWVVDRDPDGALRRAHHYLVQNGWQPADLARAPAEIRPPEETAADEGAACYQQAQRYGIAMAIADR